MITGRQDHIVGYGDQLRRFAGWPRCTLAVLDRAGHNLHLEQPALFEALVTEWLDRVEGKSRRPRRDRRRQPAGKYVG